MCHRFCLRKNSDLDAVWKSGMDQNRSWEFFRTKPVAHRSDTLRYSVHLYFLQSLVLDTSNMWPCFDALVDAQMHRWVCTKEGQQLGCRIFTLRQLRWSHPCRETSSRWFVVSSRSNIHIQMSFHAYKHNLHRYSAYKHIFEKDGCDVDTQEQHKKWLCRARTFSNRADNYSEKQCSSSFSTWLG